MARLVLTVVILTALAALAAWLADRPGAVFMVWGGYRIETSAAVLATLVAAFGLLIFAASNAWRILFSMPRLIRTAVQSKRRARGYRALTRGMVAIAAGDALEAERQAKRAEALLHEPPLTMLLSAQAAQLSGDDKAAESFFRIMLDNADMEFLGLRGLLTQSIKRKDWTAALSFAERARRLRPKSGWLNEALFDVQARTGHWVDAERTARDGVSHHLIAGSDGRHRRAVVIYGQALERARAGSSDEALRLAQKATDLDSAFVPAAEWAARTLIGGGKHRRARQTVERAWGANPHPALVEIYLDAEPGARADAMTAVQAVQRLVASRPEHVESTFALATAFAAAQLWGEARARLEPLLASHPSARAYRLMAVLAAGDGGDAAAAAPWLERASRADPDPAWVCGRCGFAAPSWTPFCPGCDSFDTLAWRLPGPGQLGRTNRLAGYRPASLAHTETEALLAASATVGTPPAPARD